MSQENVDLVREVHAGWARGDFGVGADRLTLDFEWHQFPQAVEPGTRRGEAVGGALRKIFDVYENVRVEATEFLDAGDKVVVVGRRRATGKGSGLQLDDPVALVWTLRDGKLARTEFFTDRREALAAVGLSE
jgi:ketosteroid isomerase-like protein